MPPQQPDRLLDVFNNGLSFRAHSWVRRFRLSKRAFSDGSPQRQALRRLTVLLPETTLSRGLNEMSNVMPPVRFWRARSAGFATIAALICVLLLQPLFVGSLMLLRAHTDLAPIRQHILAAFDADILAVSEFPSANFPAGGHQFTECTALHIAIDDEPDLLTLALRPQEHARVIGSCGELFDFLSNPSIPERTDYSRYWHGYRLYIWPMLEHFSLQHMRIINAGILLASLIVFAFGMRRAIGGVPAALLVVVLLSLTDIWRVWTITPHFLPTAFILFGSGWFASVYARSASRTFAIVASALLGAVFNFLDFLVNPPMMPMLLAFAVIAVETARPREGGPTSRTALTLSGLIAGAWFGGYALTWMTKWVLAVGLSPNPRETLMVIVDQIELRLYGQEPDRAIPFAPLVATARAIAQSFISYGSIVVAALAVVIGLQLRRTIHVFDRHRFWLLAAPTLIPLVWFELLSSHTRTHLHFTYRSEAAAIAIVFAATAIAMPAMKTWTALLGRALPRQASPQLPKPALALAAVRRRGSPKPERGLDLKN
jgi:hypothetical protein